MKTKSAFILAYTVSFLLLVSGLNFAQNETPAGAAQEPEVQWIWGEVISVNPQNKELTVKYLDYETETENNIVVTADDKTTYENISSLDQIKPQDNVSIDYIVSGSANIAKNISIEKSDNQEDMLKQEAAPIELPEQQEKTDTAKEKTE